MFVVLLTYEAPLSEIDRLMPEHMAFLDQCYRAGVLLASGRRVPRTGGVLLATAPSNADLEEIVRHDPFVVAGVASFEIVEFRTSQHHPRLAPFADQGTRAITDVPEGSATSAVGRSGR